MVECMNRIFYHVVTDHPMEVGQEIYFDENHHSGVYERVMQYKNLVDDIYLFPEKYKDDELEHHVKVALREFALEEVRKQKYPNYPSRMSSLYVSNTYDEAQKWYDTFIKLGRPVYSIVKVEVDGNFYQGDSWNCFDGGTNKQRNLELAEYYWKFPVNQDGKEPIKEVIVDGRIRVVEILKENIDAKECDIY